MSFMPVIVGALRQGRRGRLLHWEGIRKLSKTLRITSIISMLVMILHAEKTSIAAL
ncbi:MAG: hypothetical protein Hyperionvirus33_12 [Hyperionvirus sp.]|uniref:Uncharacterized protein n=1 Tax=Hyperionvirus sp. TaxID=2487770 RepID=A0A3G5AGZ2_9VIRU|nr:MAG: hypothetical protein Hyperionvirus33_12 [Hyperionvirus sp.]